jgi:NADPH:quinone reductase-like Zn-dependent oxidoreductase
VRAFCLVQDGDSSKLRQQEIVLPEVVHDQLLVKVHAAGTTPSELGWYPNLHNKQGGKRELAVPAHEFSGVVEATGPDVSQYKPGDLIYGMNDWFEEGALAEFCLTNPSSVALKPAAISHIEAASIPISALTAWQGLFEHARLRGGERVFIQGAAGGVGSFAVQFARQRGARILSTASRTNFDFVRDLGAEEVVDYKSDYFSVNEGSFDVVFDVVGGSVLERSWSLLKSGGRMVTISSDDEGRTEGRTKEAFFIVEPNSSQLEQINKLIDTGQLRTAVKAVLPFQNASDAYEPQVRGTGRPGKVVVSVTE